MQMKMASSFFSSSPIGVHNYLKRKQKHTQKNNLVVKEFFFSLTELLGTKGGGFPHSNGFSDTNGVTLQFNSDTNDSEIVSDSTG